MKWSIIRNIYIKNGKKIKNAQMKNIYDLVEVRDVKIESFGSRFDHVGLIPWAYRAWASRIWALLITYLKFWLA